MGTGDPFPGVKAPPGRDADHSTPSRAEVKNICRSYASSSPWIQYGRSNFFCVGQAGEPRWEHVSNLPIIFGEILSRAHGNFEQQNVILEFASLLTIIMIYIIIICCYCNDFLHGNREQKGLKVFYEISLGKQ
jgi:hypothetical protein